LSKIYYNTERGEGDSILISVVLGDDNREMCTNLTEVFSNQHDMELVATVDNGFSVLEAVDRHSPDVLVLDIIMPHLDGLGVLERMQDLDSPPKVIALSEFGEEAVLRQVMRLGASYCMLKPFNPQVLLERIRCFHASFDVFFEEDTPFNLAGQNESSLQQTISEMLREVGVPAHLRGYLYIRHAISMAVADPSALTGITKNMYPEIAIVFQTTPHRVERAIRHAITVAWQRNTTETVKRFFRQTILDRKGKPTNLEFIALMTDKLLLR